MARLERNEGTGEDTMKSKEFGHWCARVTLTASLALAGCAQMDGAGELDDVDRRQHGVVAADRLSIGRFHACALNDDSVNCWGHNGSGKLGYALNFHIGDNESASTPGFVAVGDAVAQVELGHGHTCALLGTGAVRCWGNNQFGQLGYGNTTTVGDNELPYTAGDVPLSSDAVHIAVGVAHSCALLDTGLVQCWGDNVGGSLGYGHTNDIGDNEAPSSQTPVSAGGTVAQLAAGAAHTCALLATGDVRCWGAGSNGRLGYDPGQDIGNDEAIASGSTVPLGGAAVQIEAGTEHTCALLDTGAVRCWGAGLYGQLGYGNTNIIGDNETPASAGDVPLGGTAVQISAGDEHTCALLDTGAVRCWGRDSLHQLGYDGGVNNIGDNETPASAGDVNVGGAVAEIVAGGSFTCARMQAGTVRCWGNGTYGQLGHGNTNTIGDDETPASAGNVP